MSEPPVAGEWEQMRGIKPRVYTCRRAVPAPAIERGVEDPAWETAAWTDNFTDIEGSRRPAPRFRTRAKMLWDERCFYIAANMEEPHLVATLTEKNSVIFNDNDFEIFIDPDGDNHNYYEFEINALGTIWELTLPKPYKDGGEPRLGTNLPGLRSVVQLRGTLNDPRDRDEGWSVVVAIPWTELAAYNPGRPTPPRSGDRWRINFSRVEWKYDVVDGRYVRRDRAVSPEDNWVWSPQGIVDMHRPERWGIVVFDDGAAELSLRQTQAIDAEMAARDSLMEVYHRQRVFHATRGKWAENLAQLGISSTCLTLESTGEGFRASTTFAEAGDPERTLTVRQDSLLSIARHPATTGQGECGR